VSRSRIFQLKPLDNENIKDIIRQAIKDPVRGFGAKKIQFDDDALDHLADVANGDARAALNALELAVETTPEDDEKVIHITMAVAEESIQKRAVLYDREGDCHFDTISAFIKSMRGSDPDATFYWLAKMVYAGEDPRFIFRRMTIFCSEDIGMADPKALPFVIAAAEAFDRVGLPEGHYPLAHAALYCATAPKSNSVMGFFDALKVVGSEREDEVPNHLRDASRDKEGFGHGVGYQYPHAYRDHWVAQQYLPDSLQGKIFYEPGTIGYEATLADTVRDRRELQLAAIRENDARLAPPEILTFSPADKNTERWLARAADNLAPQLAAIRERLFALHPVQRHDLVLDLTADAGAFLWEAVRKAPEGGVWGFVKNQQNADILLEQAQNLNSLRRPNFLVAKAETAFDAINQSEWKDVRFDVILGRNFLANAADKKTAVQNIVKLMNARESSIVLAENIARHTQRLAALIQDIGQEWLPRIRQAEDDIYANPDDPLVNWDEKTLAALFEDAGRSVKTIELQSFTREVIISSAQLQHWFDNAPGSFRSRLLKLCAADDVDAFFNAVRSNLLNHKVQWTTQVAFLHIAAK
ncbi:MAG: AAA family ATPase, partial [Lentisphaeria bacterium]|nr:AAA family ATPase [Lentisphaeria bacterium]